MHARQGAQPLWGFTITMGYSISGQIADRQNAQSVSFKLVDLVHVFSPKQMPFALPPGFDYDFSTGYQEVERIVRNSHFFRAY